MSQLTREEILDISAKAHQAFEAGHHEDALRIGQAIPLAPHIAMALKNTIGAEAVRNSGFNLNEAEKAYGKDWLIA